MLFGKKKDETSLDPVIVKLLAELREHGSETAEFAVNLDYLERVHNLQHKTVRSRLTPDAVALVLGNLLGIVIIVAYEQKHVITSKGLGFVVKPK